MNNLSTAEEKVLHYLLDHCPEIPRRICGGGDTDDFFYTFHYNYKYNDYLIVIGLVSQGIYYQ